MAHPLHTAKGGWISSMPWPWDRGGAASSVSSSAVADPNVLPVDERVRGRTAAKEAMSEGTVLSEQRHADAPARLDGHAPSSTAGLRRLGYKQYIAKDYAVERELGRGANGVVTAVRHVRTGATLACKTIPKVPDSIVGQEAKIEERLRAIEREVDVLRQLTSCLNVAKLQDVYEDDASVHILLELCTGGELATSVSQRHYSERTVASYMRAILKTIAQCHAHGIIHRDIKPGNFLLASDDVDARVKAIDFGLAVYCADDEAGGNLDMQGTPWFLAPEVLSSKWSSAADMWAAGVTAHQLLTGRLPFNDRRNPTSPALSAVLRSILTDKLDFDRSYWNDISQDGKDFVAKLLQRDPSARPSALEALQHPWLKGDVSDRRCGAPLSLNVVQRVQRFARNNGPLARSLLQLLVEELVEEEAAEMRESAGKGGLAAPLGQHSEASRGGAGACALDGKGRAILDSPNADAMGLVLRYLDLDDNSVVSLDTVAAGLNDMGYRLSRDELERILEAVGGDSHSISRMSMIASQLDWRHLQTQHRDKWLRIVKRTFEAIDTSGDGRVSLDELITALQDKVPADEVAREYYKSMKANKSRSGKHSMSFETFMSLLRQPSRDSLDAYDDRLEGTLRTLYSTLEGSSRRSGTSRHSGMTPCAAEAAAALDLTRPVCKADNSTRRGHDLITVFERWEPMTEV